MKPEEFINLMNETIQGLSNTVETMKPALEILPGLTKQLNDKNEKLVSENRETKQALGAEKENSRTYLTMYTNESNAKKELQQKYDALEKKYEEYKDSSVSKEKYDEKRSELKKEAQKWHDLYVNAIVYKEKYENEVKRNEELKGKAQERIQDLQNKITNQSKEIQDLRNVIVGQKTINNKFTGENEKTQKAKNEKTISSDKKIWDTITWYLNSQYNSDTSVSIKWVMQKTGLSKQRIYEAVNNPQIDITSYTANPKIMSWCNKKRGKFKEE